MYETALFYRSYLDAIDDLEDERDQATMIKAIVKYGLDEEEPIFNGVLGIMWKLIKPQIDANHRNFKNGKKGGRPPKKPKEEKPKTKPKKNMNEALQEAYECINKPLLNKIVTNAYQDIDELEPDDYEVMQDVIRDCSQELDVDNPEHLKTGYKTLREYCKKKLNIYPPTIGKSKREPDKDTKLMHFINRFWDDYNKKKFIFNSQECYIDGNSYEIVLNKSRMKKPIQHESEIQLAIFNKEVEFL